MLYIKLIFYFCLFSLLLSNNHALSQTIGGSGGNYYPSAIAIGGGVGQDGNIGICGSSSLNCGGGGGGGAGGGQGGNGGRSGPGSSSINTSVPGGGPGQNGSTQTGDQYRNGSGGGGGNGGNHAQIVGENFSNTQDLNAENGGHGGAGGDLDPTTGAVSAIAGGGGGGGAGGYGLFVTAQANLVNTALIAGGIGGNGGAGGGTVDGTVSSTSGFGGNGGDGGIGVWSQANGIKLINSGSIQGGDGGNGGGGPLCCFMAGGLQFGGASGSGGNGGDGFSASGATIQNTGTIRGGDGGAAGIGGVTENTANGGKINGMPGNGGKGGHGIAGSDLSVVNSGTIIGGQGGEAANGIDGINGYAILFIEGTNILEIHSTSNIIGEVVAETGDNTFILGGDSDGTFAANITSNTIGAAQYRGFQTNLKNGVGTWTLTGESENWIINQGILQIGNGGVSGNVTGDVNTGIDSTRNGTLAFNHSDNFTFNGQISGFGNVIQEGGGTTILNVKNTYSGSTTIVKGVLKQGLLGAFNTSSSEYILDTNGTLDLGGFDTTLSAVSNGGLIVTGAEVAGKLLTITGDYNGTGGTIILNTVLGDDNSISDRLKVSGDTSGTTNLKVVNYGGLGAQTFDGIKLIEVDGQSNGIFNLLGNFQTKDGRSAVVAGAFAYTLSKGSSGAGDGSWYLHSSLKKPLISSCEETNTCPPIDPPHYNPGTPLYEGYVQAMQALNKLPTLRQRVGNRYRNASVNPAIEQGAYADDTHLVPPGATSTLVERGSIWGRIEGGHNHLQSSSSATGMVQDVNTVIIQVGMDDQFVEIEAGRLIGGLTAQYGKARGDVASDHGDGKIDTQGWGLGGTLTWVGENDFYLDTQAQAMWYNSDLSSTTANQSLINSNKGFGYGLSAEIGKRLDLNDHWSLTPQAQIVWSSVGFDSFNDAWGAAVALKGGDSLTGRIGISADYRNAWRAAKGLFVRSNIYGIANLYQELMGDMSVKVEEVNFGAGNDRTWGGIGVGGTITWADNKYTLYGESSINTSLNNFANNYSVKGAVGFKVRW